MSRGIHLGPIWLERLRRSVALGCAAVVLALTVFAASPLAHGCLHDNDSGLTAPDHRCAVTLFATGTALSLGHIVVVPPPARTHALGSSHGAEVLLVSPRYLRQPERGPPVG